MARKKNPVPASSIEQQIHDAKRRYTRFTGQRADVEEEIEIPDFAALVGVGEMDAIEYTTERDGVQERYRHTFNAKSRPLLCVTPDGKIIVALGGAFEFTALGFVDKA